VKVRQQGRIVSVAVIVAVGVNSDGWREVLGLDIGPSEAETFWSAFLRKLARRQKSTNAYAGQYLRRRSRSRRSTAMAGRHRSIPGAHCAAETRLRGWACRWGIGAGRCG
jgi:hypothetical protein